MIDVRALLEAGHAALNAEHDAKEVGKVGALRGGNAGCVTEEGEIFGDCPRKALLRLLGHSEPVALDSNLMFQQGTANEDSWMEVLRKSWTGKILCEEEIPVTMKVGATGVLATGRPDIVLCDEASVPQLGLELKAVCSYSTARGVELEGTPDSKHLCQLGFYSMNLGIPFMLAYSNRNVFDVNYFDQKRYAGQKKIRPFYRLFHTRWTDGKLEYRDERQTAWVPTKITQQGIRDFYELVVEMREKKDLGERPSSEHVNGAEAKYDRCNYCDLRRACDRAEPNYEEWLREIGFSEGVVE